MTRVHVRVLIRVWFTCGGKLAWWPTCRRSWSMRPLMMRGCFFVYYYYYFILNMQIEHRIEESDKMMHILSSWPLCASQSGEPKLSTFKRQNWKLMIDLVQKGLFCIVLLMTPTSINWMTSCAKCLHKLGINRDSTYLYLTKLKKQANIATVF